MQSITINSVTQKNTPPTSINIPIVSLDNLTFRVQSFLQIRGHLSNQSVIARHSLFQENLCGLYLFPTLNQVMPLDNIPSGDLVVCYVENQGVLICFFPKFRTGKSTKKPVTLFRGGGGFYPNEVNTAPRFSFPCSCVLFLVCEDAWIDHSSGPPVLKGMRLTLLSINGRSRSLFFKKLNQFFSPEKVFSHHPNYKKYIRVRCHCKHKGFSFWIKIPVLSKEEMEAEIQKARHQRAQILNVPNDDPSHEEKKTELFPRGDFNHHLIALPFGMRLDLLLGQLTGGDIFFSVSGDDQQSLKIVFLSRSFQEGQTEERGERLENFILNIIGNYVCSLSQASTKNPFSCSGNQARIVHCSNNEYRIEGIQLCFIPNLLQTFFGLCLSRKREAMPISAPVHSPSSDPGEGGSGSVPGPSDVVSHRHVSGSKRGRGSSSGRSRPEPYPSKSSRSQVTATASFPPERQGEAPQHRPPSPAPLGPLRCLPPSIPGSSNRSGARKKTSSGTSSAQPLTSPERQGEQAQGPASSMPGSVESSSSGWFPPLTQRTSAFVPVVRPRPEYGAFPFNPWSQPYGAPLRPEPVRPGTFPWSQPYGAPLRPEPVRPEANPWLQLPYEVMPFVPVRQHAEESRGSFPVGTAQQTPLWRPFEGQTSSTSGVTSSETSAPSAQQSRQEERDSDSDDDIDVEND